MKATIRNIQYHPNGDAVAVLVETKLNQFYLNLKQSELAEGNWGDEDVLVAAQAVLEADPNYAEFGFTLEFPPLPPVKKPPTPEEQAALTEEIAAHQRRRAEAQRLIEESHMAEAAANERLRVVPKEFLP